MPSESVIVRMRRAVKTWSLALRGSQVADAGDARQATTDYLTGLANRRGYIAALDLRFARLDADALGFALITLDLDRFKAVNDSLGHPVGDTVLQEVAARILDILAPGDFAARIGGDEFAILLAGDAKRACQVAQAIIARIEEPVQSGGHVIGIGSSLGIALAPRHGNSPADLALASDRALYRAKANGRGGFCQYLPEMALQAARERDIAVGLSRVVDTAAVDLVYQPQLSLKRGSYVGAEALLRWIDPVHGPISAPEVIAIAGRTGTLAALERAILTTACRDAIRWPNGLRLNVNLSAAKIRDGQIATEIATILTQTGLPAERLEIDVTEGLFTENRAAARITLERLQAMGIAVALDDFGSGAASLELMRTIPFDAIKIDRSLIAAALDDRGADSVLQAILALATALGTTSVAEGVETQEECSRLADYGCDRIQGYHVCPPVPASELVGLVRPQVAA